MPHAATDPDDAIEQRSRALTYLQWLLIVVAGLVFSLCISATQPLQRDALLVVSAAAVALLIFSFISPRKQPERKIRLRDGWPWYTVFLAWCAWEVTMYFAGNSYDWPTMSILSDTWLDQSGYRFFAAALWYAGAVWLVRKTRR